jgi:hypothetical protein
MKKMIEKVSNLIEKNKENRIFCITLNSIMTEILGNKRGKDYYINATNSRMTIKDDTKDPTKMMTITVFEKNGVKVNIFDLNMDTGKYMTIDTNSTGEDVDNLRLETSKFFGNLVPDIMDITKEVNENKKK